MKVLSCIILKINYTFKTSFTGICGINSVKFVCVVNVNALCKFQIFYAMKLVPNIKYNNFDNVNRHQ